MQRARSHGFTLIEVLIVVAIIGVLTTIAIPNFNGFICKARQTEAKGLLKGVYLAQVAYFHETESYICDPADLILLGGVEFQGTQYNILTVNCDGGHTPPEWFLVTMESRFLGPGGNDIWQMNQEGFLIHHQDGCD